MSSGTAQWYRSSFGTGFDNSEIAGEKRGGCLASVFTVLASGLV